MFTDESDIVGRVWGGEANSPRRSNHAQRSSTITDTPMRMRTSGGVFCDIRNRLICARLRRFQFEGLVPDGLSTAGLMIL
jgi:hypothetical protein